MSTFEYLSVLLSIIIGVGITHQIMGLGRLISHSSGRRIYWIHLVWTLNIILYFVDYWWWVFNLRLLVEWSFLPYLIVLLEPSLLCLAGAVLYPISMPPDLEFKTHFHTSRRAFFTVLFVTALSDLVLTTVVAPSGHIASLGWPYHVFLVLGLPGTIIAAVVDNERFQGAFSIAYGIWLFGVIFFTQASIPA